MYSLVLLALVLISTVSLGICEIDRVQVIEKRSAARSPYCEDRFYAVKGHTMCIGTPSRRIDQTEKLLIVDKVNEIRDSVKPTAANMLYVASSSVLEIEAQIWAEECKLNHDESNLRFMPGRYLVGQNLLISKGIHLNWTEVLDIWAAENASFTYGSSRNKIEDVGNYTQMVYAELNTIGCGWSKCDSTFFYVCNFASSITPDLISKPYNAGPPCDDCQYHTANNTALHLCNCGGRVCVNGGKLNVTTCECDCLVGNNRYDPEYCELICIKNGDNVKCGRPPWTNDTCITNIDTVFNCPWLCHVCPYAGKNYTRGSATMPWTTTTLTTPSTAVTSRVKMATVAKGLDNGGHITDLTNTIIIAATLMRMLFV